MNADGSIHQRAGSFIFPSPPLARMLAVVTVVFTVWFMQPTATAQIGLNPAVPASFDGGRILVKPLAGVDLTTLHAVLGTKVLRSFPDIDNLQVVKLPPGVSVARIIAALQQSGLVQYAEPDYHVRALLTPNDFRYGDGSLWNLHNTGIYGGVAGADIHAPEGWDIQSTASNIIVAVIDTGVRFTHEDLAGNMWKNPGETGAGPLGVDKSANGLDDDGDGFIDDVYGINTILHSGDPSDDYGHGTHVSGTIGAMGNNTVGVVGVAWRVKIMALKFLDSSGQGSISDAVTCIDYARSKGAKIINASWGGYNFNSTALYDAINRARSAGIIFVAACGNDGNNNDTNPLYPASFNLDNIIAVAATDRTDTKAGFSNYGATTVELAAPGSPVFSSWNGSDSDYRYLDGTSMAAPHVAGACALLMTRYPNDTYRQIINRVLAGTDPLPSLAGKCVTGGRLNLFKALNGTALTASFTANPMTGTAPLTVNFTDTSTGTVASRLWTFGDGTPNSNQQNPSHVYNQAGAFNARLVVTDSTGAKATNSQVITVTGWMVVTPAGNFSSTGQQGGPFSPANQTYTVKNQGNASINWSVGADQPWVNLSATAGTLAAGQQQNVTVTFNSQANSLPPSTNTATITFNNLYNGDGNTTRQVILQVAQAGGYLSVSPQSGFTSQGTHGGPFSPTSKAYTLSNTGGASLNWTATKNKSWISVSSAGGTLASSASTGMTVSINANANLLKAGTHTGTVTLANTTNGKGNLTLTITLKVQ